MRSFLTISISLMALLLAALTQGASQADSLDLRPGDPFPPLTGQTLSGKQIELPRAAAGKQAIVILSFSRAGGHDSQTWSQHLSKDAPGMPIYTVIFLESVPSLFRGMAVSGIKSKMPPTMLDRTILLYQDAQAWEKRFQLADEDHACVVLLKVNGAILWTSSEPFSDARYLGLLKQIRGAG